MMGEGLTMTVLLSSQQRILGVQDPVEYLTEQVISSRLRPGLIHSTLFPAVPRQLSI